MGDFDGLTDRLDCLARESADPLRTPLETLPLNPPAVQWANFLRNHDELSLEFLASHEREEAFNLFAPKPDMRTYGRGIRRRLAPSLGGDRSKIELDYGPDRVNVAAQRVDPESLLNWGARAIRARKQAPPRPPARLRGPGTRCTTPRSFRARRRLRIPLDPLRSPIAGGKTFSPDVVWVVRAIPEQGGRGMEHDEFIRQVQNRARLDSRGAAEQATRATLETLGERLSGGAAKRYDTDVSADSWRDLFKGGRARKR